MTGQERDLTELRFLWPEPCVYCKVLNLVEILQTTIYMDKVYQD